MHNAFANTSITVGSAIKTGKLLQPIMDKMNAWMQTGSAYAGQYIYCDVPDVECGELAFTQDDFWTAYLPTVHPTAAGHRYIADRILSVLPDTALPFEDVPEGAWYYMDVAACYYRSLMVGVADTRFAPDLPLDRAMVATIGRMRPARTCPSAMPRPVPTMRSPSSGPITPVWSTAAAQTRSAPRRPSAVRI